MQGIGYLLRLFLGLILMTRPPQLLAFVILYLTGGWVAESQGLTIQFDSLVWGLVILILGGMSIHYSNEYADVETDRLTQRTLFSGGSGAIPMGWATAQTAFRAMWVTLLACLIIAIMSLGQGVINFLTFGILVIGIFLGWMYSLPPLKFAWRGWGEVDNAVLGGLFLPIYGYVVHAGVLGLEVILAFMPFTLVVFVNLLATTYTDKDADKAVGKHTLATQWDNRQLRRLYAGTVGLSLVMTISFIDNILPIEVVIGNLVVLPFLMWGYARYTRIQSPHPTVIAMIVMMVLQAVGWTIA